MQKINNKTYSNLLLDIDSITTFLSTPETKYKNGKKQFYRDVAREEVFKYIFSLSKNFHLYLYSNTSTQKVESLLRKARCNCEGIFVNEAPNRLLKSLVQMRDLTFDYSFSDTLLISGSNEFIRKGADHRLDTCLITDLLEFENSSHATYNVKRFRDLFEFSKDYPKETKKEKNPPYIGMIGTREQIACVKDTSNCNFSTFRPRNIYISPENIDSFEKVILNKDQKNYLVVSDDQRILFYASNHGMDTYYLNSKVGDCIDFASTYEKRLS